MQMCHKLVIDFKLESASGRGWKGNEKCVLCGVNETATHIFFSCPLAQFVWCIITLSEIFLAGTNILNL
jgi:hypothetical protein